MSENPSELKAIYAERFAGQEEYRERVWRTLIDDFFQPYVPTGGATLDLGCGHGEFINQVQCARKYGMDLNPATAALLDPSVQLFSQDCSQPWELGNSVLDVVFTSNFFEHLPNKRALSDTLAQACRCLKSGGRLMALGPNIKYLPGAYWDFWDHHLALTELALQEALTLQGFKIERCISRFLPYTMSQGRQYPPSFLKLYLKLPFVWPLFGKQFLVIARKDKIE